MNIPDAAAMDQAVLAVTAMFTFGMGLAFTMPDLFNRIAGRDVPLRRTAVLLLGAMPKSSPATVALAYALESVAFALVASAFLLPEWTAPLARAAGLALLLEYLLQVGRVSPDHASHRAKPVLRGGQIFAVLHALLAFSLPAHLPWASGALLTAAVCGAWAAMSMARHRIDEPERIRMKAVALALPLFTLGLILIGTRGAVAVAAADIVLLAGATHHLLIESQRGHFLGQFLAPQVAELVRQQGLEHVMAHRQLSVSVVCCDLRGYTALTESAGAAQVLELLSDYYDAVGKAVTEVGGTIKDQAGDGILILIGAPLPVADHAARALSLARRLRVAGSALRARWSPRGLSPGLGVGVATGEIAAGVIGRNTRLEYTAVGPAVNLAARLCSQAVDGEVLADARTIEAAGTAAGVCESRPPMALKGISRPVALCALLDSST